MGWARIVFEDVAGDKKVLLLLDLNQAQNSI